MPLLSSVSSVTARSSVSVSAKAVYKICVHCPIPQGHLSAEQYLAWDQMSDRWGEGLLRLGCDQSLSFEGALEGDLSSVLSDVDQIRQTANKSCGRGVGRLSFPGNPFRQRRLDQLRFFAERLASLAGPGGGNGAEIRLETLSFAESQGSRPVASRSSDSGKLRLGLTLAGLSVVDLASGDLWFAATFDFSEVIDGFHVLRRKGDQDSEADWKHEGWIPVQNLFCEAQQLVTSPRRILAQERQRPLFEDRPLPAWKNDSCFGWHPVWSPSGARTEWSLGWQLPLGRLEGGSLKQEIRELVERYRPEVWLMPQQCLLLTGLTSQDRKEIERS